ncbi:MAG TPA: hypothetical protein VN679_14300 [Candidatus Acidoferrales bacterium]|nr:hypothetical protein [Candidatus Acidoferrales bacterium]
MGRKILAGILGGLAFFAWSSIAHLATDLGQTGLSELPNEQAVVNDLKANITAPGLYFFPGYGLGPNATHSQKMAAMKDLAPRIKAGPIGLMVYHPTGYDALSPRQMLTELATNIIQVLLAVFLLGQTSITSFAGRWRFITVAGILAAISTNVSYWNWYGFPANYTLAYISVVAMGFVCAGLVAAALVKPAPAAMAARA